MTITLETLILATEQEVFDQVATHLLIQNARSADSNGGCFYRLDTGEQILKCAAGCLLTDEEAKVLDNCECDSYWSILAVNNYVPKIHLELINELQEIHDNSEVYKWKDHLTLLASQYKLNIDALVNL